MLVCSSVPNENLRGPAGVETATIPVKTSPSGYSKVHGGCLCILPAPNPPTGRTRQPGARRKFYRMKNPIFQRNFRANPSRSVSAEGARQFGMCRDAAPGAPAVTHKGARSPMANALLAARSRSWFFLSCMYKSLSSRPLSSR